AGRANDSGAPQTWCRVWTESELARPRTYHTRWHSLAGVGWPMAAIVGRSYFELRHYLIASRKEPTNWRRHLLGLAIKQEFARRLDATLRRVRACRQSLASVSHHRHMMASLAVSHTDDDREFEWITFAGSLDLDHSYLHRNRCSRSAFSVPKRAAADGPISCSTNS